MKSQQYLERKSDYGIDIVWTDLELRKLIDLTNNLQTAVDDSTCEHVDRKLLKEPFLATDRRLHTCPQSGYAAGRNLKTDILWYSRRHSWAVSTLVM